jgi:hypothetical protein
MKALYWIVGISIIAIVGLYALNTYIYGEKQASTKNPAQAEERALERFGLQTDTLETIIDLDLIVSGGPGKDGIPALNSPAFSKIEDADFPDEAPGIFIEFDGERRFYPYAILVWHEIVNDRVGSVDVAVTFCPLCATGIVFDRRIGDDVLTFGVSGLLFESNLLMYDTGTESLWSQAKTEAVVGSYAGTKLNVLPMQLITFRELEEKYPEAEVLSTDTGYRRDYQRNPYAGYEETEALYYPVSVSDKRYPAKEILYVIPLDNASIALPYREIQDGKVHTFTTLDKELIVERDGSEIFVTIDGASAPGYYEMWFSWATHHQDDGIVLEP